MSNWTKQTVIFWIISRDQLSLGNCSSMYYVYDIQSLLNSTFSADKKVTHRFIFHIEVDYWLGNIFSDKKRVNNS